MLDLNQYLKRIHYSGPRTITYQTLAEIHHQHLLHIPYENGYVQLGVPLDFDLERIFEKLVHQKRGGWCYEMNGLLGWALTEIGFDVTRMSGAVMRATEGDGQLGNHLVLEVKLAGQTYLADVGLGDGLRYPIPIEVGKFEQAGLEYELTQEPDGYWRFHNQKFSNVDSFDFKHQPADENELQAKCHWLQTDPSSPFKMVFIVNRFTPHSIEVLHGKVHTTTTAEGKQQTTLTDLAAGQQVITNVFGLDLDIAPVWAQIEAAHQAYFAGSD